MARDRAKECRELMAAGEDPRSWRQPEKPVPTFGRLAEEVIASLESGWRNEKHRAQWRSTIAIYCGPIAGKRVDQISNEDVLKVLQPIWTVKAETASRLRGRIEKILDAAKAKGHREGENPARWRGNLDHWLPSRQKLQRGHHPAMPWQQVPEFVARLRKLESVGARCLEFIILTGARSGEVLKSVRDRTVMGLRWDEINRDAAIWTCPAVRMKGGRDHRKPLTSRLIAILDEMEEAKVGPFVFPAQNGRSPLSEMACEMLLRRHDAKPATVHGFRTSFRTWVAECTSFPGDLAEMCIDHIVGNAVERAYQRGDALDRRREIMEAWAAFCDPSADAKVIPLHRG
jgi:integrase